jgi:hypothetical protein
MKGDALKIRKDITRLFIIILALASFIEGAMTGLCFCKDVCPPVFQGKADLKILSTPQKNYPSNSCKMCDIEGGKDINGVCFSKQTQTPRIKFIISILTADFHDYSLINRIVMKKGVFSFSGNAGSTCIYLKTLSLRC